MMLGLVLLKLFLPSFDCALDHGRPKSISGIILVYMSCFGRKAQ